LGLSSVESFPQLVRSKLNMPLAAGTRLGFFEILAPLGKGGMGEVYRAKDTKLERVIAVKILPEKMSERPQQMARFEREAKLLAALDHPYIAAIHGLHEDEGRHYLVMELVDGETLAERLGQGPLPVPEALELAGQIAEALEAAHKKGIIHRDLKPSNIMRTDEARVKLLDFGLGKALAQDEIPSSLETATTPMDATSEGVVLGTAPFMSPEQARGEEVDQRTDVWAFATVLFEMLTGKRAFPGRTGSDAIAAVLVAEPDWGSLPHDTPPQVRSLLQRCLQKDKSRRLHDIADARIEIEEAQRAAMGPSSGIGPVVRWASAWPRLTYGISVIVLVTIAGLLIWNSRSSSSTEALPEQTMIVVLPFENLGLPEDAHFAAGMTEEITNRLARVSGLGVISRRSAQHYASTDKTIKQIGDELGVGFVLAGAVRWARGREGASRIRITQELIRVADDTHLWAEAYDRVIDDVFEIQSEIAHEVVEQLGVRLLESERPAMETGPTKDLEAYRAYIRGRYYVGSPHFSLESWEQGIENFGRAVELDPEFTLAYAELAKAHSRVSFLRHNLTEERRALAQRAVERAVELAPDSGEVHVALGYYYLWARRDVDQALRELTLAEEVLPNDAGVLQAKAAVLQVQGHWQEAADRLARAFELSPRQAALTIDLAQCYWVLRRYREALEASDRGIALAPDQLWPHLYKALIIWSWKGPGKESRAALEAMPQDTPWATWAWFRQELYEGRHEAAIERLSSTPGEWIRLKTWARPKSLLSAQVLELLGQPQQAHAAWEEAASLLEAEVSAHADDPRYHSSLGIAYASLGRGDEARREGKTATDLLPTSKDAFYGLFYVVDLAHIHAILGERDAALDRLEYLLSSPSWFSVPLIRVDPRWNPLRDHPRFEVLVAEEAE